MSTETNVPRLRVRKNLRESDHYADNFGPSKKDTEKHFKSVDWKRRAWQCGGILFTLAVFLFIFSVSPSHFDVRFPHEKDLIEHTSLRKKANIGANSVMRYRLLEFMADHCQIYKDYDILFCMNVLIDTAPLLDNCFMDCATKTFYYNVEIVKTDNNEKITCNERYATMQLKKSRTKHVIVNGLKNISTELQEFKRIPNSTMESCLMQHAVEVVNGVWLD